MARKTEITVIIPVLNGAGTLRELLASFTIQTLKPSEVVVVDSASRDDSVKVAEEYGAKVISISQDQFDHGGTRAFAGRRAQYGIIVYFTQDVLPAHRNVIRNLVKPLESDETIAVSYGRQLPAFDAEEIPRHLRLFNYSADSYVRGFDDREQYGLQTVFASNSCAAYKKEALEKIDFFRDDLIFGEDTIAVGRLLKHGYKVAYAADADVYHSHNYSWSEEFRRYFDIGVLHTVENWLLDTYGSAENRGVEYMKSGISHLSRCRKYSLIADFMVRVALKFLGYRLGRHYTRIPGKILPELSMNRNWWQQKG